MRRINLYYMVCMVCMLMTAVQASAESYTVTAGNLEAQLGDKKNTIVSLTLSGSINGSDIRTIRQMGSLTSLDLKNTTVVAGGAPYYGSNYTEDNKIGNSMFYGMSRLESITLPTTVTSMGSSVFQECVSLINATLPANLTAMGVSSFYQCTSLKSVVILSKLTYLPSYSFKGCTVLESVTLPSSITSIGYEAFHQCTGLKSIALPGSLKEISNYAFRYSGLESITIPEGVTSIGGYSFRDCKNLKKAELPSTLGSISDRAFLDCTALTQVIIPEGVTELSTGVFSGCTSLITIQLPSTIYRIGEYCFSGCTALSTINIPNELNRIEDSAFSGCASLTAIYLPPYLEKISRSAFQGCTSLTAVDIPCGTIENNSFMGCTSLKTVTLPIDLMYIQEEAFSGCSSLEEITIPARILSVGNRAFANTGLKKLTLADGLRSLPTNAFSGCYQLETVVFPNTMDEIAGLNDTGIREAIIPEGPTKIGTNAFAGCFNLNKITLPTTIDSIKPRAFLECDSLRSINVPEGVVSIGAQAFSYCDTLETITLPSTLKNLEMGAFAYSGVKTINIPASVDSIASGVFTRCTKLESITLPEGIKQICGKNREQFYYYPINWDGSRNFTYNNFSDIGAFSHCTKLKDISLPSTLTEIGYTGFYECDSLRNITLPNVTKVQARAFYQCDSLMTASLPNVTEIGNNAFYNCKSLKTIDIPKIITLQDYAFQSCRNISKVVIPATLENLGQGVFSGCTINTVEWNVDLEIPQYTFESVTYLFTSENVTGEKANATYIIRNGLADNFTPSTVRYGDWGSYQYIYEIQKEFKARTATYQRRFTQTSGVGEAAGWETIVVPFDVNKFLFIGSYTNSTENIALAPFGSEELNVEGTRPFWLYEMTATGPKSATTMKAHTPYLICMPNNSKYPQSSNIYGYVNFIGEDLENGVLISETNGKLKPVSGNTYNLIPVYETTKKSDAVYKLNIGSYYDNKKPGSVFVKNYGDIDPFYAYATPKASASSAPQMFSIGVGGEGGATGIGEELLLQTPDRQVKATSVNGILYLVSDKDRIVYLYDTTGRTVRQLTLSEGSNTVVDLADGIYFLEGQKVIVKR